MEMENKREIAHRFHEHPLVFVEEQSNEGDHKAYCSACRDLLSGPCFSCALCNYHLHQKCAEAPYSVSNHPLHPQHRSGFFLRQRPDFDSDDIYGCALCKEKRDMFFYECKSYPCNFSLDIKCFHLSSSYKLNQESKHDFHQHPLTFIQSPMDELKRFNCTWCLQPLLDSMYFCFHCPSFVFHKICLDDLPSEIHHPSHTIHSLFLESNEKYLFCMLCQKKHSGYFYSCSLCPFNIRVECAWPRSVVEDKRHHQHAFTLFWRQGSFICDACDTEGKNISYICSTCCVIVHKECTQLPRIIKISRHAHCLFHKYFLAKQELTRQDCKICFEDQVKVEHGSYSCLKAGCNYIVHVNCALEDKDLYDVIENESQCEELCAPTQSSIIRVIEENEDGEATKIEHSSHEGHCLVLADKMEEETDRKCDGCILPLSTPLYYCSESDCHFCLHKICAELPRIKQHWFRKSSATLQSKGCQKCALCRREWSGFFYNVAEIYDVCLRCTQVPDIIQCEGHQHFLFFDFKCKERCNGCGSGSGGHGAFRCRKCGFTLDFGCITLPDSAFHKFDQHMLKLTYSDDNHYKEHCYCDICEAVLDPNLWYYHCSTCDTSAHPNCVLGQFSFLKDGTTWPYSFCPSRHNLIFLKKTEDYPNCYSCGRLCQEEILKCKKSTCNYIIHQKCWLD